MSGARNNRDAVSEERLLMQIFRSLGGTQRSEYEVQVAAAQLIASLS